MDLKKGHFNCILVETYVCRLQLGKLLDFCRLKISLPYTTVVWCI